MRITGPQVGAVTPSHLEKTKKAATPAAPAAPPPVDRVELSRDVSVIEAARDIIAGTPDVREEKVEALRQQVRDGSYRPAAEDVAEKMLAEIRLSRQHRR